jgi:hypothetical protein
VQASFSQQRLWLLWQLDPQSTAYNQPALLSVRGAFDAQRLERSLQALVQRHEALRTNFRQDEQQVLQARTATAPSACSTRTCAAAARRSWSRWPRR